MPSTHIRLPSERADQLRLLAASQGVPITTLLNRLITAEIERLGLAEEIGLGSDINVDPLEDGTVGVCGRDLATFIWTKPVALGVADAIERVTNKKGATLDIDAGLQIDRVGTSVRLKSIEADCERTFAPSVALDLAAIIRSAASTN